MKVLAPELLAGISFERFHREVLLAAQLQHPHVVPVLTAGEAAGLPWFSMPYVDGDSLRQRLERGPVPTGEVISILRDVARALAYAHARGIVHRDIKPDNVLLSGGSATVTDFGIAKAITAARTDGGGQRHDPDPGRNLHRHAGLHGARAGGGGPERRSPGGLLCVRGDGVRADRRAAAVPGQHAGATAGGAHVARRRATSGPSVPTCPAALAELIMTCLAKDPDGRPQQASELVRVLETVTTSGNAAAVPAVLHGGRFPIGKALGLWAAATATVGVTAWAATEVIGLPDWVFPGSLGVMLAGLPVIGHHRLRPAHRVPGVRDHAAAHAGRWHARAGHAGHPRAQGESPRLLAPDLDRRRPGGRRVRRAGGGVHGHAARSASGRRRRCAARAPSARRRP